MRLEIRLKVRVLCIIESEIVFRVESAHSAVQCSAEQCRKAVLSKECFHEQPCPRVLWRYIVNVFEGVTQADERHQDAESRWCWSSSGSDRASRLAARRCGGRRVVVVL